MLRSTRRGLETWHGRDRVTLADERARQQGTQTSTYTGAPVLDPTCEGGRVRFPSATRLIEHIKALEKKYPALDRISVSLSVGVPENVALEQLDRLAKEVMPAFKEAKAPQPMLVR